jgi:hypothetical protein
MANTEKAKGYAGVLLVLEDNELLSMKLFHEFKKNIASDCGVSDKELDKIMEDAKSEIHFDSSSVFVHWK